MTTQTEQLLKSWVPIGYRLLQQTAERYGGYITSSELAARVQDESGRHGGARPTWVGQLLELVSMQAARIDDAPLASLCVQSDLGVGDRYERILAAAGRSLGAGLDAEQQAAEDRLACYRAYAVDLPEDGGRPQTLVRKRRVRASGAGATTTRARTPDRPAPVICPTCFMQMPATGVCDSCG